jgi:glycosyltransferase involved in cell wall biosynthesis
MNNGLDQAYIDQCKAPWSPNNLSQWQSSHDLENRLCIISSARLEKKNRFEFVVMALSKLVAKYPSICWILIGEGNDRENLEMLIESYSLQNYVLFVGEVYAEEQLAPWFLSSVLFLHPGSIGLSLMHAYGYKLPVVTHNNEVNHSPEFAIFQNGVNGFSYEEGDINDFIKCLSCALEHREDFNELGFEGYKIVKDDYNTKVMADRFFYICELALTAEKKSL